MSDDDQSPQQPRDSLSWPDVSKPSTGHQPPYGYPQQGPTGPLPPSYGSPPPYKGGGPGGRIVLLVAILLAVTVAAGVLGWLIFK